MQRVKLEFLQKEIDDANNDEEATQLIIASCPSRIGEDNTIMEQVENMVGSGKGHRAATCCFSYERNVVSTLKQTEVRGYHSSEEVVCCFFRRSPKPEISSEEDETLRLVKCLPSDPLFVLADTLLRNTG